MTHHLPRNGRKEALNESFASPLFFIVDLGISSGNLENERVEKMIGKRN